ncbi:hypothetical protein Vi05172_g8822 [Venturia inaequalis]|uniref:Uncharacterized protein n=1 Tax=Venturia inaequalis TaxID=5025 RepID=A0A8H3VID9_VENIN|nr:hypothetical protein EG327_002737 [Venturia inaequalis]RDI81176.1 hypothetical protein Vi05172_g8822 [Venturia inaequalis]
MAPVSVGASITKSERIQNFKVRQKKSVARVVKKRAGARKNPAPTKNSAIRARDLGVGARNSAASTKEISSWHSEDEARAPKKPAEKDNETPKQPKESDDESPKQPGKNDDELNVEVPSMDTNNMPNETNKMIKHIQLVRDKIQAAVTYLRGPEFRNRDVKTVLSTHRKYLIESCNKMGCVVIDAKNTLKMMLSMSKGCSEMNFLAETLDLISSEWESIEFQNDKMKDALTKLTSKRSSSKFKLYEDLFSMVETMHSDLGELIEHRIRLKKEIKRLPDKET